MNAFYILPLIMQDTPLSYKVWEFLTNNQTLVVIAVILLGWLAVENSRKQKKWREERERRIEEKRERIARRKAEEQKGGKS